MIDSKFPNNDKRMYIFLYGLKLCKGSFRTKGHGNEASD